MQVSTDTENDKRVDTRPPSSPSTSTVDFEDMIEVTETSQSPLQSILELPREPTEGQEVIANSLATHEEIYQEIVRVLKHEETKLDDRRKKAGGDSSKSKKLVQVTFELLALKQFNDLRIEYHQKKAKDPNLRLSPSLEASTKIAKRLRKTDYYARRLRERLTYLHQVGELQVSKRGKGAAHRSLLAEPQVVAAIQTWVKGGVPVEKGGYVGQVQYLQFKANAC